MHFTRVFSSILGYPQIIIHIFLWDFPNNVLLVKIEGPVWYTIYHRLPRGKQPPLLINQPMGRGHLIFHYKPSSYWGTSSSRLPATPRRKGRGDWPPRHTTHLGPVLMASLMDFNGFQWVSMDLNAFQWVSMVGLKPIF